MLMAYVAQNCSTMLQGTQRTPPPPPPPPLPPNTGSTSLLMNLLKNYTAGIVAVSDHFFLLLMVQLSKQHRLLIITVYHLQSLYVDFSSTDSTVSQLARLERDVAAKC